MKLIRAYRILEQECEFLGMDWERLMYSLRTNPMIFPQYVLEAYGRTLEDQCPVLEGHPVIVMEDL